MKRSPAIPPRATSLLDPEAPPQVAGLHDLISDGDPGVGPSRRSPPLAPTPRGELLQSDTLETQRNTLVAGIAADARRSSTASKLDEAGRAIFEKAGFGDRIDRASDIEVTTHMLKPVVHVSCFPFRGAPGASHRR